ncbi:stage II sporulation protein M [Asticcacaulis sp. 201]|uniref:stage II sporulation protein M n=1 Tax=Asticcacaulis sp. 201 TaxID=3028787 RepID=UPI0029160355|nr:stage II sporulation protein M [Asticcacaulis sp. 201]MDV6330987.1 stage II sporulation protein M [Asticcacaulis sp. 201]
MVDRPGPSDAPRPALRLKSQKFREARQGDWRALSGQLDKAERRGLGSFSVDELLNLPVLYRSTMSSLSMAQSISLDRNMITYLQALCVRAYVYIYGPQTRLKDVLSGFFIHAWPNAVRKLAREMLLTFLILIVGGVAGWLLCAFDSNWYNVLLPSDQAQGRDLGASVESLRKSMGGAEDHALSPFAVFLMTHNVRVAIMTFAMGAIFGLPTFAITLYTGITAGAMIWLFASKGLGYEFVAWLTIHGTTEFFALIIAAACGFHIARRLMFPGDATRRTALAEAGLLSGTAMIGVAIMLTVAGCLEGIGRQTITDSLWRILIGLVMLTIWSCYFLGVGRKTPADAFTGRSPATGEGG